MDKDRIAGSGKQVKGSIKIAVGKAIGDTKLQVEGEADKTLGKAQNMIGTVKDSVRHMR
ncbi:MAG: CsbD family protein [Parvibaculaceae bacterium]